MAHQSNWRVRADRAWRSPEMRRKFEDECNMRPLDSTEQGSIEQYLSGYLREYHEKFTEWVKR